MKKTISFALVFLLLFSVFSALSFADATKGEDAILALAPLRIMQGDPDGNLRLSDSVSRAECIKMAVAASLCRDTVPKNLAVSPYKDVPSSYWAAPYIKVAVDNGLCKGYTDATFRPSNTVTYEEALTIFLKVLGYTDADFGVSWPHGQVGLADSLKLTKNMGGTIGMPMTRQQMSILAYNTLNTKMKGSPQLLFSIFDCRIIENGVFVASSAEDASLGANKVFTSSGSYMVADSFDCSLVGRKGDLVIQNDSDLIAFVPTEQLVKNYTVDAVLGADLLFAEGSLNIQATLPVYHKSQTYQYQTVLPYAQKGDRFLLFCTPSGAYEYGVLFDPIVSSGDAVLEKHIVYSALSSGAVCYKDGALSTLSLPDSTLAYKDNQRTTFGALKGILAMGDILYIKRNEKGTIDYVTYEKGVMDGPVTYLSTADLTQFVNGTTKIMRGGTEVTKDALAFYDILYYQRDLNVLLAYRSPVVGVYERALPNKDTPASIVLSGKTYAIEGAAAFSKLSSAGSIAFGETVTLLLGRDGQVADVLTAAESNAVVYGYLIETGKMEFLRGDDRAYTANFCKVMLADGQVFTYQADKDYKDILNSAVRGTFTNGVLSASAQRTQSTVSGTFSFSNMKLGATPLSADAAILDVVTTDKTLPGSAAPVFAPRLDGLALTTDKILCAELNSKGEICSLLLNDVTGDGYSYGIVTEAATLVASGVSPSGKYTYDIQGTTSTLVSSGTVFTIAAGQPARFRMGQMGQPNLIEALKKANGNVSAVTPTKITVGAVSYTLSDKVAVYTSDPVAGYRMIPYEDLLSGKVPFSNTTVFYDKLDSLGGRVRVIIVA